MNERIKKLRKALDLTQSEFANRIGTTANVLTNYETGRRNPSSSVINNICKEFNVNEAWLRDGTGEMFNPAPSDTLDALAKEYKLTHGCYVLIEKFLGMNPQNRQLLVDYVMEVSAALNNADSDVPPDALADPECLSDEEYNKIREQYIQKNAGVVAARGGQTDKLKELQDLYDNENGDFE